MLNLTGELTLIVAKSAPKDLKQVSILQVTNAGCHNFPNGCHVQAEKDLTQDVSIDKRNRAVEMQ